MPILFIVESPGKVKKISAILGNGYKVIASVGHVRDLPVKKLGVDLNSFDPTWVDTNKAVINKLKDAAKSASDIYLACDPDREGEAIAYHLYSLLGNKGKRVTFQSITKNWNL